MDRDRLKEVHKADATTESRVNEDFVEWLKTKGLSWLVVVLFAVALYLGMVRWREGRATEHIQAWRALADAELSALPTAYTSVADDYPNIDSIAHLARLRAAQRLLGAVQMGRPIDADPQAEQTTLSEMDREQYLGRADRLYLSVLDADDGSAGMTLHAVSALNGRAAVAEARGNAEEARRLYEAAAQRAERQYPHLAQQSRRRAEAVDRYSVAVSLPSADEVPEAAQPETPRRPAMIEPPLRDLILPGTGPR